MARRRYKPEEIIAKLREAETLLAQGMTVPKVKNMIAGSSHFLPSPVSSSIAPLRWNRLQRSGKGKST